MDELNPEVTKGLKKFHWSILACSSTGGGQEIIHLQFYPRKPFQLK